MSFFHALLIVGVFFNVGFPLYLVLWGFPCSRDNLYFWVLERDVFPLCCYFFLGCELGIGDGGFWWSVFYCFLCLFR